MRGMRYALAAVVSLALVTFWGASGTLEAQTQADWNWANKEFGSVLDRLMPLKQRVAFT